MIDDESSVILPENSPADLRTTPSGLDVTGNEVITEAGSELRPGAGYRDSPLAQPALAESSDRQSAHR
jgi:hypothetical protein